MPGFENLKPASYGNTVAHRKSKSPHSPMPQASTIAQDHIILLRLPAEPPDSSPTFKFRWRRNHICPQQCTPTANSHHPALWNWSYRASDYFSRPSAHVKPTGNPTILLPFLVCRYHVLLQGIQQRNSLVHQRSAFLPGVSAHASLTYSRHFTSLSHIAKQTDLGNSGTSLKRVGLGDGIGDSEHRLDGRW
jgi:hypothetical protein